MSAPGSCRRGAQRGRPWPRRQRACCSAPSSRAWRTPWLAVCPTSTQRTWRGWGWGWWVRGGGSVRGVLAVAALGPVAVAAAWGAPPTCWPRALMPSMPQQRPPSAGAQSWRRGSMALATSSPSPFAQQSPCAPASSLQLTGAGPWPSAAWLLGQQWAGRQGRPPALPAVVVAVAVAMQQPLSRSACWTTLKCTGASGPTWRGSCSRRRCQARQCSTAAPWPWQQQQPGAAPVQRPQPGPPLPLPCAPLLPCRRPPQPPARSSWSAPRQPRRPCAWRGRWQGARFRQPSTGAGGCWPPSPLSWRGRGWWWGAGAGEGQQQQQPLPPPRSSSAPEQPAPHPALAAAALAPSPPLPCWTPASSRAGCW